MFLHILWITKEILLKIELCTKILPDSKQRKISVYIDSRASSATHGVTKCKIYKFHERTWNPKIKYKISALGILHIIILAVFWLCLPYIKNSQYRNFILDFHRARVSK